MINEGLEVYMDNFTPYGDDVDQALDVGIMILVWLYDTYVVLDGNPLILCREKVHALSFQRGRLLAL